MTFNFLFASLKAFSVHLEDMYCFFSSQKSMKETFSSIDSSSSLHSQQQRKDEVNCDSAANLNIWSDGGKIQSLNDGENQWSFPVTHHKSQHLQSSTFCKEFFYPVKSSEKNGHSTATKKCHTAHSKLVFTGGRREAGQKDFNFWLSLFNKLSFAH